MIILPAIDIKDGECVRLFRGEMSTASRVAENALQTALDFKAAGAEFIHMVDLNGAISGQRINSEIFIEIAEKSGLKVELGGGIRTMEDIDFYISSGIHRVVLGSAAIKKPALAAEACKKYPGKIAAGIDAVNGKAAISGWVEVSSINYLDLARQMEEAGIEYIIFTDINRDGMLSGPNLEQLAAVSEAVSCKVIASGGITDIEDIKRLRELNIYGAICGRSIYSGTLDLKKAIAVSGYESV